MSTAEQQALKKRLDSLARRLDAKIREFRDRGELSATDKTFLEGIRKQQASLEEKLEIAIKKERPWDVTKSEFELGFGALTEELVRLGRRLDAEEMKRSGLKLRDVAMGWSVKRQVLGAPVFNDLNEHIGDVDDIIIAPNKAISYVIINAGGFLQVTKHDVAVPVSQLKLVEGKLMLPGATRDTLKASPAFE